MSTSAGTLQPKVHIGSPLVWAVVALFAAAAIAVYALTTTESREETASSRTTVSGTAANTPTEVRGGFIEAAAAPIAVEIVEARNAMMGSYLQAPIAVEIVEARNAMLGSYLQAPIDEILVNGEPCAVCWKYR